MSQSKEIIIDKSVEELEKAIQIIKKRIAYPIPGGLRISRTKEGRIRYYHKYKDGERIVDRSLRRTDPLIKRLAMQTYYRTLESQLKDELAIVKRLEHAYDPGKKYRIYDQLSDERKKLVDPLFLSPRMKAEKWESEGVKEYEGYKDGLRHETERGDLVRSKSERTIANLLYQHRDVLAYKYEAAIYLPKAGITVHPDFIIMNRNTGRIFYWEHVGMLDMEEYRNEFVMKMNAYILEGYFPADNFIMTFETGAVPENVQVERSIISKLLVG